VVVVVDVSSRQENQPQVLQVDVDEELVEVVVVVVVVVLESKQENHPGVLQVSVLVLVDEVLLYVEVVVVSEPLLSKYDQLKQSVHPSSVWHSAVSLYTSRTSLITLRIL
jgi:hypothetical protein